jgi:hypothetical protein
MDSVGDFILGLPAPVGMVATALFPVIAIGAGAAAILAYRRARPTMAVVLAIVSLLGLLGALAFVSVAGRT